MDRDIDSYSGFYDNGHRRSTGLAGYLRERKVEEVTVCGLAADYCVYFTIMDALKEGFDVRLVEDATRPISQDEFTLKKKEMKEKGVDIILSSDYS